MKGFVQDIEGLAVKNADFRRVLYTAKHCQLVIMALNIRDGFLCRRGRNRPLPVEAGGLRESWNPAGARWRGRGALARPWGGP